VARDLLDYPNTANTVKKRSFGETATAGTSLGQPI
jgi:hypothetical protein